MCLPAIAEKPGTEGSMRHQKNTKEEWYVLGLHTCIHARISLDLTQTYVDIRQMYDLNI